MCIRDRVSTQSTWEVMKLKKRDFIVIPPHILQSILKLLRTAVSLSTWLIEYLIKFEIFYAGLKHMKVSELILGIESYLNSADLEAINLNVEAYNLSLIHI
eukprot:TRINITY_DN15823_c0_g1_i4.p4 TRINITY_DN15823_c0_g1~~TRINITY_DN15823_c0_g1_i4.p4  ORF type:complete len:101 (-),score=14.43 TRINITY_DN15823_c0_g1_i4:151-453(-)